MTKAFAGSGFGALCSAALAIAMATTVPTVALADDTIKIGVLLIDSGPLASLKETQAKAANLAIEQINAAGGAAGKKFEAVFITYPGTPDTAVDGATRAVQKDGAMFITGMDTSSVSPALQAKLPALKALMVEVMANADGLTGKGCSPNYFRVNANDSMIMGAFRAEGSGRQEMGHHRGRLRGGARLRRQVQGLDHLAGRHHRQGHLCPVRNAGLRRQDFGTGRRAG
jgi:branched-chain amino acid transport system substrate-binding protein